jgi:hypothetical protein
VFCPADKAFHKSCRFVYYFITCSFFVMLPISIRVGDKAME